MKCQSISFFEGVISKNCTFLVVMSLKFEFFVLLQLGVLKEIGNPTLPNDFYLYSLYCLKIYLFQHT